MPPVGIYFEEEKDHLPSSLIHSFIHSLPCIVLCALSLLSLPCPTMTIQYLPTQIFSSHLAENMPSQSKHKVEKKYSLNPALDLHTYLHPIPPPLLWLQLKKRSSFASCRT